MRRPLGVVVAKACAGEGDVGIDRQPFAEPVVVGELEADAPARPARLGGAGVADEHQLRVEVEPVQRRASSAGPAAARCARRLRAPWIAASGVTRSAGAAALRIDRDHRAARVVAVEAAADVDVVLGLRPRPEDQAQLRADDASRCAIPSWPGCRCHVEAVAVDAQHRRRCESAASSGWCCRHRRRRWFRRCGRAAWSRQPLARRVFCRPLRMLSFCSWRPTWCLDLAAEGAGRASCGWRSAPSSSRRSGWSNWSPLTGSSRK